MLREIKAAEAEAAKQLEEAKAAKQQVIQAAQLEVERLRRDGMAAVDRQVAEQIAEARRRVDASKSERLVSGRAQIRRKKELAEARAADVADFVIREFERHIESGMR